eukprot:29053-Pelagococcus_subviridis.AAC.9
MGVRARSIDRREENSETTDAGRARTAADGERRAAHLRRFLAPLERRLVQLPGHGDDRHDDRPPLRAASRRPQH